MGQRPSAVHRKKRRSTKKKVLISVLIVFSVLVGLVGCGFLYIHHLFGSANYQALPSEIQIASGWEHLGEGVLSPSDLDASMPEINLSDPAARDPQISNIMLFGYDPRWTNDGKGLSDTMILLSLDNRHGKIKLTSFMRDTWVNIPGIGENRLNAAYSAGGVALSIQTVERNFGIKVDKYASVNFNTFAEIVDILGGVEIDITQNEANYLNKIYNVGFFKEGPTQMDGELALQYARARHVEGDAPKDSDDFGRTQRQRKFLYTMLDKFKGASVGQMRSVLAEVMPKITTDITVNEMIGLTMNGPKYLGYAREEFRLPTQNNFEFHTFYPNGVRADVLTIPDMEQARRDLLNFVYEDGGAG
jgi:LCP family protein required for cell wall assembly